MIYNITYTITRDKQKYRQRITLHNVYCVKLILKNIRNNKYIIIYDEKSRKNLLLNKTRRCRVFLKKKNKKSLIFRKRKIY